MGGREHVPVVLLPESACGKVQRVHNSGTLKSVKREMHTFSDLNKKYTTWERERGWPGGLVMPLSESLNGIVY